MLNKLWLLNFGLLVKWVCGKIAINECGQRLRAFWMAVYQSLKNIHEKDIEKSLVSLVYTRCYEQKLFKTNSWKPFNHIKSLSVVSLNLMIGWVRVIHVLMWMMQKWIHEDAQIMYIVGAIVSWLNQMSIKMADIPEPFFFVTFFLEIRLRFYHLQASSYIARLSIWVCL